MELQVHQTYGNLKVFSNIFIIIDTKETAGMIMAIYPYIIFFTIRNSMQDPQVN